MLKGFITNLGKYNEGYLVGEWIDFPIDEDELKEVLQRIGISHEPADNGIIYEEYFFSDWDCEVCCNLGEYVSIEEVNDIAEDLQYWEADIECFEAACEMWSFKEVASSIPDNYIYLPDVNDDEELGEFLIASGVFDMSEVPKWLECCIDYEVVGRQYSMNSNGGFTEKGWICKC